MSSPESATIPRSCEPVGPGGTARLAHQHCARVRPLRLGAPLGDAVVPDHRRGEADELLRVARVGHDLLVARHRGREDGFSEREALGRHRLAAEDRAVLEREEARHPSNTIRPSAMVARTFPRSVSPRSHEFFERERKPSSSTRQLAFRSSSTRFARAPTAIARLGQAVRARRLRPTSARGSSRAGARPARRGACRAR